MLVCRLHTLLTMSRRIFKFTCYHTNFEGINKFFRIGPECLIAWRYVYTGTVVTSHGRCLPTDQIYGGLIVMIRVRPPYLTLTFFVWSNRALSARMKKSLKLKTFKLPRAVVVEILFDCV